MWFIRSCRTMGVTKSQPILLRASQWFQFPVVQALVPVWANPLVENLLGGKEADRREVLADKVALRAA